MLDVLRSGGTITEAAEAIGTYRRAVTRYADQHGAFRVAMDHARAEGERATIIASGTETIPVEIVDAGARVAPVYDGPPRAHTIEAAAIMDVDVDLVADVDALLPVVPGLPAMSALNVLAYQWRIMHNDAAPPILRKACNDVVTSWVLGPAMAAQQRRNERASRLALAETVIDVDSSDGGDLGGEGLVILSIPANGSEAPGSEPQTLDPESDL